MSKQTFVVELACKHIAYYSFPCPEVGEVIHCRKCGKYCAVTSSAVEYRAKCRACKYSKAYGTAKINAELGAVKHRKAKQGHIVDILLGTKVVTTFGDKDRAAQRSIQELELPPF